MYEMHRRNGTEKRQGAEHRKSAKRIKRRSTPVTRSFHLLLVLSVLAAHGTTALAPLSASEESSTGLLSSVQLMSFDMPFDASNTTCDLDTSATASVDLQSTTDRAAAVAVRAFVEALRQRGNRDNRDNRFLVKLGWAPLFLLPPADEQRLYVQQQWRARLRNRDIVHPVVVKSWYDSSGGGAWWNVYHHGLAPIDGRHSELVGCQHRMPVVMPGSVVKCRLVVRDTFGDRAPLLVHERRRVDLTSTFQVVLHADDSAR